MTQNNIRNVASVVVLLFFVVFPYYIIFVIPVVVEYYDEVKHYSIVYPESTLIIKDMMEDGVLTYYELYEIESFVINVRRKRILNEIRRIK